MPAPLPALPQPPEPPGSFLFSDAEMQKITEEKRRERRYRTADRVPEPIRKSIIKLLKDSWTHKDIAEVLHVHKGTVSVIENHPDHALEIEQHRSALIGAKSLRAIQKQLDRLNKHPDFLPYQAIGFTVRALYDIHALEAGKPTERTECTEKVNIYERYETLMLELKKEMAPENTGPGAGKVSLLNTADGKSRAADSVRSSGSAVTAAAGLESDKSGLASQLDPGHVTGFGLAARKNSLLVGGTKDSSPPTGHFGTWYLALTWQRAEIQARISCRDRRFLTPPHPRNGTGNTGEMEPENGSPVTNPHLFRPNERRRVVVSLPISQPICEFFGAKCRRRGAGVTPSVTAERARPKTSHGIFAPLASVPDSNEHPSN